MYSTHAPQGHHPHLLPSNHMPNPLHPAPNAATLQSHHSSRTALSQPSLDQRVVVQAIPSVTVQNDQLLVGDSHSTSTRSYTLLKLVGDGSFGTVWLCDWHGALPPNTPLSAMQCSSGTRSKYAGKTLVAVKRMKKRWEGGWDECRKLKELESLRAIPYHPNVIPLYDFFLLPDTKELYFVFESMEGNLYQLIKTRKSKQPLAGGLVASIFQQVVQGLHHIHACGYFHRDMKPENLLVTTTGLHDYRPLSPIAHADAPPERDVVVIVKIADFGLARETTSLPPYTEYVSTRWYRAPEVLLRSRDYSNPVDMWALGTIMAELVNLRPLFPGEGEIDQISRICEVLGDPFTDWGTDPRGRTVGGGKWPRGVKMAKTTLKIEFPKIQPMNFYSLFDPSVPIKLVDCIADLLRYDPNARLTSLQCLEHPYLSESIPLNNPPGPPSPSQAFVRTPVRNGVSPAGSLPSVTPRSIPPSHSFASQTRIEFQPSAPNATAQIPDASSSHRSSFYDSLYSRSRDYHSADPRVPDGQPSYPSSFVLPHERGTNGHAHAHWDAMDVSPRQEHPDYAAEQKMDFIASPMARDYPARPPEPEPVPPHAPEPSHGKPKLGVLGFGKKSSKWGLSMFGHGDKGAAQLPPVQEAGSAGSTPSLKRTQSVSSTDSRSLPEFSPVQEAAPVDAKARKEEAKRIQREMEVQKRAMAEKKQRDQARSVMEKQKRLLHQTSGKEMLFMNTHAMSASSAMHASRYGPPPSAFPRDKGKQPSTAGRIRHSQSQKTVGAAGGSFSAASQLGAEWRRDEREPKARRREFDDDHSMSSSDLYSVMSFATVDSDPGPARARLRPGAYGLGRMTSLSSLQTSFDEYARSSASLSLEQQLVNDFHARATFDSLSDHGSPPPPPMQLLSLSSPVPWQHGAAAEQDGLLARRQGKAADGLAIPLPPVPVHPQHFQPAGPHSPYEVGGQQPYGYPSVAPKSAINPMFKVAPLPRPTLDTAVLPPFSELEAVADGDYPPLSPMSFTSPEEISQEDS